MGDDLDTILTLAEYISQTAEILKKRRGSLSEEDYQKLSRVTELLYDADGVIAGMMTPEEVIKWYNGCHEDD